MGQKSTEAADRQIIQPRHALEGAEASGARIQSAVRGIAARMIAALDAAPCADTKGRNFSVADCTLGRRDGFDGYFTADRLCGAIALDPGVVPALLIGSRALAALLVERNYGGRIEALGSTRLRRPGRAEAREFGGLMENVAEAIQHVCAERGLAGANPLGQYDAEEARALIVAGEAVAAISFDLMLPPVADPQRLVLLLPLAALRMPAGFQPDGSPRDGAARRRWAAALSQRTGAISMAARSVIARPMLSMGQLMALRLGDIIPITVPRQVPLFVADRRIATGTIGERDGRVAFMIDQLEREDAR